MLIKEIEVLIKRYGYENQDYIHCDHAGLEYDKKRMDDACHNLIEAIEKYAAQAYAQGARGAL